MNRTINIDYEFTGDYTKINPPVFLPVTKIYNLILLPVNDSKKYNIKKSDTVKILDKNTNTILNQKCLFSCDNININDQEYFYFYIANGITNPEHDQYAVVLNNETINLTTNTTNKAAKLLIGSLILDDDYSYMFDINIPLVANINNKNYIKFNITNKVNKYNYYKALTNNTILFILDSNNLELLNTINSSDSHYITIRPLYYANAPLGSLSIKISNYIGVSYNNAPEFKVFINNKSYYINSNSLNIKNLASNNYTIKIIDKNGPLIIGNLNGQEYNNNEYSIFIPLIYDDYKLDKPALPIPRDNRPPSPGLSNLMINLDNNISFELLGPNNTHKMYNGGYQSLYNISSGDYIIKYNNQFKSFYIPADTTINIP